MTNIVRSNRWNQVKWKVVNEKGETIEKFRNKIAADRFVKEKGMDYFQDLKVVVID